MKSYDFVEEYRYDVVVCGSGPAGLGAAMSARLSGAEVMLLESANLPGGIINAVPWMSINRLFTDKQTRSTVHDLFAAHVCKYGDDACHAGREGQVAGDGLSCHVEYSEMAIYDMLEECGVNYRMYSPAIDVIKEGNVVQGVIVREKRGFVAYYADVVVDATGDGDVAVAAGCEYMEGKEDDGIHMAITLGFSMGGIDKKRFYDWLYAEKGEERLSDAFDELITRAEADGYYVAPWHSFEDSALPGIVGVTNGAWRGQSLKSSGINSADLTAARRNGLKVAIDMVRMFKDFGVPGTEHCYLERTGNILGVRDTRRIVGEYVQTYEDSQKGLAFEDVVARKYGYIDGNQIIKGPMVDGYSIPYGVLLPKRVDGLLLAGRCASMTFLGHCAGKSMGNMMEMGVAAGVAAGLCSKQSILPRQVDVSEAQRILMDDFKVALK